MKITRQIDLEDYQTEGQASFMLNLIKAQDKIEELQDSLDDYTEATNETLTERELDDILTHSQAVNDIPDWDSVDIKQTSDGTIGIYEGVVIR